MIKNQPSQLKKILLLILNLSKRLTQPLVRYTSVSVLLGWCLVIIQPKSTSAQTLPPPPVTPSDVPAQEEIVPVFPHTSPRSREYDFVAPSPTSARSRFYRVEIDGDSSQLLSEVKKINSDAFIRKEEGIIQAGLFSEQKNAEQFAHTLQTQGFSARVVAVGTDSDSDNLADQWQGRAYFVVIPGSKKELSNIAAELVQLGVTPELVTSRKAPIDPHVAVGPFTTRGDALRWNSHFRSIGMDARVYFGR